MITQSDIDAFSDGQPRFSVSRDIGTRTVLLPVAPVEQAFRIWMTLAAVTMRLMLPMWVRPR